MTGGGEDNKASNVSSGVGKLGCRCWQVKWRVGAKDPWRNVDLTLKILNLGSQKMATDAWEKTANVEERATSLVEKPRHQGSGFGRDKSYVMMDKINLKRGEKG
jgi:hypothetical protein